MRTQRAISDMTLRQVSPHRTLESAWARPGVVFEQFDAVGLDQFAARYWLAHSSGHRALRQNHRQVECDTYNGSDAGNEHDKSQSSPHGAGNQTVTISGDCPQVANHRASTERRDIAPARKRDHDAVVVARSGVVAFKSSPQASGFHAHDGIGLRIEGVVAPERADRDAVSLDAVGLPGKRLLNDEAQERRQSRRGAKIQACDHPFERGADLRLAWGRDGIVSRRHDDKLPFRFRSQKGRAFVPSAGQMIVKKQLSNT
jgi:hypothetical protein